MNGQEWSNALNSAINQSTPKPGTGVMSASNPQINPIQYLKENQFKSADAAAIAFGMLYAISSAEAKKEFGAYIYTVTENGVVYYTYSDPYESAALSTNRSLKLVPSRDLGIPLGSVAAVVHTHGGYRHPSDNRFSPDDSTYNSTMGWQTSSYTGLYLVAPNGTLQFWDVNAERDDKMIRVVSTDMPKQDASPDYVLGSEQYYRAVEKTRSWYYYINPFNWGNPINYTVYERVR